MCDFSLHAVKSRPAKVGDKLITRDFGTGSLPAPEANHAVRAAIDEALKCKQDGTARTILFNLSGHGNFDMQAYADYLAGKLEDRELDQKMLDAAFAELPRIAA